jgi:hypothetical protein
MKKPTVEPEPFSKVELTSNIILSVDDEVLNALRKNELYVICSLFSTLLIEKTEPLKLASILEIGGSTLSN